MEYSRESNEFIPINDRLKCSFCSVNLTSLQSSQHLTETMAQWFMELTQIEIRKCPQETQQICLECSKDLKFCIEFRNKLIEKQKELKLQLSYEQAEDAGVDTLCDDDIKGDSKNETGSANNPIVENLPVKIECIDVICEPLSELSIDDSTRHEVEQVDML
jgi:pyruvate formate-lyase activating enzyme-like uncharacterized protein